MSEATTAIIQSWQERAQAYHQMTQQWPLFTHLADRLVDLLPAPFRGTAIDLAAGAGLVTARLLARHPHARVYVVEPARAMLDLALQRAGSQIVGYAQLPAEEVDRLSVHADAILCSAAMHLLDEVRVFPGVARCLKPSGGFVFNLWWHSWEATAERDPGPVWRALVEQALAELGEPPGQFFARSQPRVRTGRGINKAARAAGLSLVETLTDTDVLPLRFFIEFAAMSPTFLAHLPPARRAGVLDRARACARTEVEIHTTRFVLRR